MNTKIKRLNAFNYIGGKQRYLDFILPLLPEHEVYIEPFCGSASIFLNKKPSKVELINDLDKRIYNFFKVLRDRADELINKIELTPYSRTEFQEALKISADLVEDARRFFIRANMNYGGSPSGNTSRKNSIRFGLQSRRGMAIEVSKLNNKVASLHAVANRLKVAMIENRPAQFIIPAYDRPEAFFFCDMPYIPLVRSSKSDYDHEMTIDDHKELAAILNSIKGRALVCGYPHPFMDELYPAPQWQRITGPYRATNLGKLKSVDKIECAYINYKLQQAKMNFETEEAS